MMKVLIVDDDSVTRTNIKTLADWSRHGYEICGEAANGMNAIQLISSMEPDIVITDMSMPVMDGVALIEYMEKNHPGIKVIALSGYDDFDYVRQSMKKGAVDYILKHRLDSGVLLNVLKTASDLILNGKRENDRINRLKEQLTESRAVLRQNFIRHLISGVISEKREIEQKLKELDIELDMRNIAVVAAEIDDFRLLQERFSTKEINKLTASIMDMSVEILKGTGKAVITQLEDARFVILFSFGKMRSDLYIYNQMVTALDRIKVSIRRYLNITACFSLSRLFDDITEISRYYKEAEAALGERFFNGKDRIIKESNQMNAENDFFNLDIHDEKKIIAALKSIDRQRLEESVESIFMKIIEKRVSYKSIQMICAGMINIINRIARESGIDVRMVYSDVDIPYDQMKKYETVTEVKQWILQSYYKLIKLMENLKISSDYTDPTKKAIEYIQRNYSRDISLNDVAGYIGVNSSYLSRVFKESCGKGFVEYLNLTRIEHAKRLIEEGGMKLKDVVKEVGFNNYTYFFKVFKDNMRMTPLEFEEACRSRQ